MLYAKSLRPMLNECGRMIEGYIMECYSNADYDIVVELSGATITVNSGKMFLSYDGEYGFLLDWEVRVNYSTLYSSPEKLLWLVENWGVIKEKIVEEQAKCTKLLESTKIYLEKFLYN